VKEALGLTNNASASFGIQKAGDGSREKEQNDRRNPVSDHHRVFDAGREVNKSNTTCQPCASSDVYETLWFLVHGKFHKAFRRSYGIGTVKVGDSPIKAHYPSLKEVTKLFLPAFLMRSCTGIGVAVPPSYLQPIFRKHPRLLGLLCVIDRNISRLPFCRTIGDHMLLHFERAER
jgi:hypothetical protein